MFSFKKEIEIAFLNGLIRKGRNGVEVTGS